MQEFQKFLDAIKSQDFPSLAYLNGNKKILNMQDENGDTLLHHALRGGNLMIVQMLIGFKADLNIKNNDGVTALDLAKEIDNPTLNDTIAMTLKLEDEEDDNEEYNDKEMSSGDLKILMDYISNDDDTSVAALLDKIKPDVNTIMYKDKQDRSRYLIDYIIEQHAPKCLTEMIKRGLDINVLARYQGCFAPLHLCLIYSNFECAKILLNSKNFERLNYVDDSDQTALDIAATMQDVDMFKLLLDSGADIHRRNIFGESVLDYITSQLDEESDNEELKEMKKYLEDKGCQKYNEREEDYDDYFETKPQYGYLPTGEYAGLYTLTSGVPTLLAKDYKIKGVENPQAKGAAVPYYLALVAMYDEPAPLGFVKYKKAIKYLQKNGYIINENDQYYFVQELDIGEIERMYDHFEL